MKRLDDRSPDQLRAVKIHPGYLNQPAGSVLIEMGETRVVCAASIEDAVPRWMREQQKAGGWVTAEYSMLPFASTPRKPREISRGRPDGRTQEIQRLVGRAMRAIIDLEQLGSRTIWIDCDVLQADGGTRTASITGAYVALMLALRKLVDAGGLPSFPVKTAVAAISVGIVDGEPLLDLCYEEDARAAVDMNVVMTGEGEFVELQGTGEESTFKQSDLARLVELAGKGIAELLRLQETALNSP